MLNLTWKRQAHRRSGGQVVAQNGLLGRRRDSLVGWRIELFSFTELYSRCGAFISTSYEVE